MTRLPLALLAICLVSSAAAAPLLDKRKQLEAQSFWANRDFDWFEANIPFFECPDAEINTTYYYRWELVTRHIIYGSPNSGYSFTEFANRPFWSGAYGGIACPSGHQIYEIRWLKDPEFARDFLHYWFRTPGAQPRNYSSWLADCAVAVDHVHPNKAFLVDLLPDLEKHHEAWRGRQWVDEMGMFWQTGHDDGMEFNINSRQTKDILRGDRAFRPTFNTYMWADLNALAEIAEMAGDSDKASSYRKQAAALKTLVQEKLWDPKRQFFFPMSSGEETDKEGNVVKAHTLTYESGKFAGSEHGRELHGYVPWAFNLPDPGKESAWKFLMDPYYFKAPFGPSTTERNDPMFLLQKGCCWWSGQSWPFATTQTLKAMANVLHNYPQEFISRGDYADLLHTFAISHRKDGKPYIAEALHPDTGSWEGHDMRNRSEHYFHSNFNDLVITGLAGLKADGGDTLTIDPLAPDSWDYFALDSIAYQGHELAICWDKKGDRYGHGAGLHVLVDGKMVASSPELGKLEVKLPAAREVPLNDETRFNYAVNNDGDYFPSYDASHTGPGSSLAMIHDGQYRYDTPPTNRWTSVGSGDEADWVSIDLGMHRPIDTIKLFLLDDGEGVVAPSRFELQHWDGKAWVEIPGQNRNPKTPAGGRPNTISFAETPLQRLRVVLHRPEGASGTGITEFQAWGSGTTPYQTPPPAAGNLSTNTNGAEFPKASASFHDRYGGVPKSAIDGRIIFLSNPVNRWTTYGSPNETDWLEVDFGKSKTFSRVELHIYDDRGGVQAPTSYKVQYLSGDRWVDVNDVKKSPEKPKGSAKNSATFEKVTSQKIRVVFTNSGKARSGLTEFEVWEK
ncbi:MAG: hypothetical protein ACJAQT_000927 [Akkermansiaceae bacterium]|jgi:hypothetical protein